MVISYTCIWVLWTYQNDVTFLAKKYRKYTIIDTIKLFAFNWLCHRNSKVNLDWIGRLTNPMFMDNGDQNRKWDNEGTTTMASEDRRLAIEHLNPRSLQMMKNDDEERRKWWW
ncbi:hypothetical protein LXL04_031434 [Taraxacum kok-saghyz]